MLLNVFETQVTRHCEQAVLQKFSVSSIVSCVRAVH